MTGLIRENFPLYCCGTLDDSHVVVGGGGGAAKTGVPNAFDILKMIKPKKSVLAESNLITHTGDEAAWNMHVLQMNRDSKSESARLALIAVGLGGNCSIFSVSKSNEKKSMEQSDGIRKRERGVTKEDTKLNEDPSFAVNKIVEIKTDFSDDPFQKSVRINPKASFFVTGGSDGYVRAWEINTGKKIFAVQGHKDDVGDIDISPDGEKIVTVSRDGTACEWTANNGHKSLDLHTMWNSKMLSRDYKFKFCRYGKVQGKSTYVLFTAHAPIKRDPKLYCDITKWSRRRKDGVENKTDPWRPVLLQRTGKETLSAFNISDDGVFLGLGFMDGSVAIYISFSLQCARKLSNVHSIFVTGLTFLNQAEKSLQRVGDVDAALVSISADNTVKLTTLSSRTSYSAFVAILMCFLIVVAAAFTLYYFQYI